MRREWRNSQDRHNFSNDQAAAHFAIQWHDDKTNAQIILVTLTVRAERDNEPNVSHNAKAKVDRPASTVNPFFYFNISISNCCINDIVSELRANAILRNDQELPCPVHELEGVWLQVLPFHRVDSSIILKGGYFTVRDGSGGSLMYVEASPKTALTSNTPAIATCL